MDNNLRELKRLTRAARAAKDDIIYKLCKQLKQTKENNNGILPHGEIGKTAFLKLMAYIPRLFCYWGKIIRESESGSKMWVDGWLVVSREPPRQSTFCQQDP